MIRGPTGFGERMFPSFLSANSLTLIGQMPILFMLIYVFATCGFNISPDNLIDGKISIASGLLVQWFSQLDIMDGLRARRMKVGSPLGRIIDEAGDCIVMSNYSILIAYMMCFDNKWWELIAFYMNLAFYGEEIRYKITSQLVLAVGQLSAVEIEIIVASSLFFGGYYGSESLQKSFGEHFEIESDSYFSILATYRISSIFGCLVSSL